MRSSSLVAGVLRSALQRAGAHAVDRAIWHLGLGRQGIRLTGSSLGASSERWEAEVTGWKASIVAEAAELIALRALSGVFDLEGGESIALESLNIRWLRPQMSRFSSKSTSSAAETTNAIGKIFLEWSVAERETFRRETLSNLTSGAVTYLTIIGCDKEGLGVVHVDLEVRASTRPQISGVRA